MVTQGLGKKHLQVCLLYVLQTSAYIFLEFYCHRTVTPRVFDSRVNGPGRCGSLSHFDIVCVHTIKS